MRLFDHDATGGPFGYGWGFRQYMLDGERPVLVIDTERGIYKPKDDGLSLSGGFDIYFDAMQYVGLAAPFIVADIPATLIRAFPSSAPVAVDFILQPGGARNALPVDAFVPGDNDIWSVSHA